MDFGETAESNFESICGVLLGPCCDGSGGVVSCSPKCVETRALAVSGDVLGVQLTPVLVESEQEVTVDELLSSLVEVCLLPTSTELAHEGKGEVERSARSVEWQ